MKRHELELLAAAFKAAREDICIKEPPESCADLLDGVNYAAEHVADALARVAGNNRAPTGHLAFDRERFLRNAGVTET